MICSNCNKINDSDSKFCKYCGDNLKPEGSDPHHTIFENQPQPVKTNTELGYMLIALLIALNAFLWMSIPFIANSLTSYEGLLRVLRIFSSVISIGQFVVMLIFARRRSYRIVIGIIAAFVALSNTINLFRIL